MGRILIEGTPVALFSNSGSGDSGSGGISVSGHLLLIYQDDAGNEFVVRGGPTRGGDPDYGPLIIEQNVPIARSIDARIDNNGNPVTPASRGSREIPLGERKAEDVWNLILQHAKNINDQSFPYSPTGKNSNGTVGNLLDLIGINVNDVLPDPDGVMLFPFSGKSERFEFDYNITGTDSNDIIVGRGGNQNFTGGKGNDTLTGGKDNDILDGGDGQDTAVYSGNFKDYKLTLSKADFKTVTIAHDGGTNEDGTDTLTNIEFAQFKDKKVPLKGLDLAFVIDTTGSMFDDIDAVKTSANDIINRIFDDSFPFSRVAVVGYNDPFTETFLSFTDQEEIEERKTAAINAINSISVGGGGDFPEAVNAGLIRALSGGAGEWNKEAVSRTIILFGDAPPNDEELRAQVLELAANIEVSISGGFRALSITGDIETSAVTEGLAVTRFALSAVDAEDTAVTFPVQIFTILIGNDPTTAADFDSLATATGGKTFNAADAGEIVSAILNAIDEVTQTPIALGDSINTDTATVIAIDVLANDSDPNGDPLTITKIQNQDITTGNQIALTSGAVVTLNPDGTLTYNPNGQFDFLNIGQKATDTFTYSITDGKGGTDTATVSIDLTKAINEIVGTSGRDELIGTANSDRIIGLQGADKLTGGGGNDQFVYTSIRDRGDTITDFEVGRDQIVLTQLLDSLVTGGYNGTNALVDGYVKVVQGSSANNFSLQIDSDGFASGDIFRPFITVNLATSGNLNNAGNFVF